MSAPGPPPDDDAAVVADPTPWTLYVVRCADRTLYTGVALDVEQRLARHRAGLGAKYLRGRGPLELVFSAPVGARGNALRAERAVKALSRRDKLALVAEPARFGALLAALERRPTCAAAPDGDAPPAAGASGGHDSPSKAPSRASASSDPR